MARPKRKDKTRVVLKTGEGQRTNGTYFFRWTDKRGERHSVYAKTLDELRYKEEQIEKDKKDGIKAEARFTTVNDLFELWIVLKRGLKNNTFENYKYIGSPLHLRQILLNLFSNAAKYNKENGTIETHAEEIACDENTATFRFTIRDTGIGMSEDFVNNELFEPFTQEKQDARTQYQGTGLGMSIVKELIEKMNGTITVESVLSEGSAFTVTLPFEIDKHPSAQAAANGAADETALHGLKVLLAEDNELNMEIAEFFLEDMGAETMQAWNGKEAVEAFRNSAPGEIGVILMDIMMPVMDGLEAVQRIRALDRPDAKTVPIIAMTANAFSEDVERSRKAGMTEHLSKPLNAETLKKAILRNI